MKGEAVKTRTWSEQLALPFDGYSLADLPARIANKIQPEPGGCWLWAGSLGRGGYGAVPWRGRTARAHRVVVHLLADPTMPVFPGRGRTQLDHLCRTPRCVNPAHLELVSNRENGIRGRAGVLGAHSSNFVGVHIHDGRFVALITVDGVQARLGSYPSGEDAAAVYDAAALMLYGDATNSRLGLLPMLPTPLLLEVARARIDRFRARREVAS